MWNKSYQNSICNQLEKLNEQRLHINRVLSVKGQTNTSCPLKPKFLKTKLKKQIMEEEIRQKIEYENNNLLQKIVNADNKPSKYSIKYPPHECPAFNKEIMYMKRMQREYNHYKDNINMYKKLSKVKSYYETDKIYQSTAKYDDIVRMIRRNDRVLHPCLDFQSPSTVKKKIENDIRNSLLATSMVESSGNKEIRNANDNNNNGDNSNSDNKSGGKLKRAKSAVMKKTGHL
jgi:hypothetical protein